MHAMLDEFLEDRAALYVSGAMTAPERDGFEVLIEANPALRTHVAGLRETAAAVAMLPVAPLAAPAGLKARLLGALDAAGQETEPEALVVTGPHGLIEWVNPAFTAMCGYELAELKGRKPGALLQGPATDAATVARIRSALRERRACRETLVNYHKDGSSYRADVHIMPLLDDVGQPRWLVARERKLPEEVVPVG
jgi:PAS domain S-box-containing protein